MSEDKGHGYGWADLRERPARDLAVGDTFVSGLSAFTVYRTDEAGNVYPGLSSLDGTAWTVTAREGDVTTCRSHDGRAETKEIPEGARVLLVVGPEPVGTVLAVGSHRARRRLERALGRKPAAYWTMKRGGKFVVLYGEDVATALGITFITRTRLKPDDVVLCMNSRTIVDDAGLRVTCDDTEYERRDADRAVGRKAPEATA